MVKLFRDSLFFVENIGNIDPKKSGDLSMNYSHGSEAPEDGAYEELNIFGTSTGITERLGKGEWLPLAPQGYTWRKVLWAVAAVRSDEKPRYIGVPDPTAALGVAKRAKTRGSYAAATLFL
jgi:hypothetical protein